MVQHFHFLGCLAVVTFMSSFALSADNRDRFEARTFADGEFKLPYRLLKPKPYDAAQKYPLVIFLHGAGERGNDNEKQLVHGMNDFASDEIMAKHPAFVLAPQCPEGEVWGGISRLAKVPTPPDTLTPALDATLKAAGGRPKYTEYSGVGHNSWAQTYSDPALYDWLFAQRKQ